LLTWEAGVSEPRRKTVCMKLRIFLAIFCIALASCGRSSNVSTRSATQGQTAAGGAVIAAAGTDFYGKLQQPISSKKNKDGDTFQLAQTDTLMHKTPALHGAVIDGHLEDVHAAGPMHKPGMVLVFDDVTLPDGTKQPADVRLVSMRAFDAKTHHLRTIGMMIGGAFAGHEMKRHTGKGGGMLGAAGGYALSQTLKTDIYVPAGTVLELRFNSPVRASS